MPRKTYSSGTACDSPINATNTTNFIVKSLFFASIEKKKNLNRNQVKFDSLSILVKVTDGRCVNEIKSLKGVLSFL